ncbi:MAG: DUF937 domain-containing protein [Eubacteriales bacterium]|nr:DUF937 domain-containing protein [Eubacteriales bacterium]MDD3074466.1 DUF937 domain-containing protein [Eubacteriales bacterium]
MDVLNLVTEQINSKDVLSKIGKSVGAKPSQVKKVTELGMPALVQALQRNVSTADGAAALNKALDQHKDDKVDDVAGFLNNIDVNDGAKILKHVFSGNDQKVQKNIAKQVGVKTDQVSGIMAQLAPLLLGALGTEKKQQNLGSSGISDLLDILSGNVSGGGLMNIATSILDADGDGDIIDDVGGILSKLFKTTATKGTKSKSAKSAKTSGTAKKTTKTKKITRTKKKKTY